MLQAACVTRDCYQGHFRYSRAERARRYSTSYISTVSFQSWKKVGMECAYMS
ncbi:hypothetical protein DPMN_145019 [Dreissena polymorpha]|uniref:Uncharacterized protein n=1 Tax=Dreissena polymorpha TaxID=45954 RepID=A0A9D4F7I9_DREPO|nr:hypothetical protein DPMN_145019 [Dreissena polymorpha]